MTERGLPIADGASACPFVAFDDDRDERSSVPDHRHRCYAETPPAPRAIAHQEAYCLSSAFPVCPTFQDWARREAARARGGSATSSSRRKRADDGAATADVGDSEAGAAAAAGAAVAAAGVDPDDADSTGPTDRIDPSGELDEDGGTDGADDARLSNPALPGSEPEAVRRNPPRDWSAPPPWLASAEGPVSDDNAEPPPFVGRRGDPAAGLAGSAADRLAGGAPPPRRGRDEERVPGFQPDDDGAEIDDEPGIAAAASAGAAAGAARKRDRGRPREVEAAWDEDEAAGAEPRRIARRSRAYAQHLGGPDGPDWEKPRRYEAYPTIRTRVGMPQIPRLAGMAAIIALLALALFLLPGLLNLGGGSGSGAPAASTSTRPAGSVASLAPTQAPAPTPVVYTLKKNDTLLKIATRNGLTLEELLAANPAIKNPNRVAEGQQIIIPAPSGAAGGAGGSTRPSAGGSGTP